MTTGQTSLQQESEGTAESSLLMSTLALFGEVTEPDADYVGTDTA